MAVYFAPFLYCLNLISLVLAYPITSTTPEDSSRLPQGENSPQAYHGVGLWRASLNPSAIPEIFPELLDTEAEDLGAAKEGEITYKLIPKWPDDVLQAEASSSIEQQPAPWELDTVWSSGSAANGKSRKPRTVLTPTRKRRICNLFYLSKPRPTRRQLAWIFGVSSADIGNIVRDPKKWVGRDLSHGVWDHLLACSVSDAYATILLYTSQASTRTAYHSTAQGGLQYVLQYQADSNCVKHWHKVWCLGNHNQNYYQEPRALDGK
ncbi:hypothetical protein FRB95_002604 [Tulasnella sp. JGI-2019a]|nr:hypothetical protein FRB95_002604 [Tulasnella sp. JGI-2019a]